MDELVKRLRSLKVLLGTDSPEVRGWSSAVQQAAQKTVNDAIDALSAQPQQEPVATVEVGPHDHGPFVFRETPYGVDRLRTGTHKLYTAPQPTDGVVVPEKKLWLWKNLVDGRPEYWAFDNPYPTYGGGDPMTLGEPCGYALFKESTLAPGHADFSEADVIAAIQRAAAKESR